jgi:signal transduction histidine kinase
MIWRPASLRFRILAWYGGTVLAVLGVVLALVHLRVNAETGRHVGGQMEMTRRVVESLQRDRSATLAVMARLAGEEPRLGSAMTTHDPATVGDLVRRDLVRSLEADFIRVTDEAGLTMVDTSRRSAPLTDLSGDPAVRRALEGRVWRGLLIGPGELALAATAPIRLGGQDLGTVTVGQWVDDLMAQQLHQETGSHVTFFAGLRMAASSWPAPLRQDVQAAIRRADPGSVRITTAEGSMGRREFPMVLGGHRMAGLLLHLVGHDGRTGRLLIQSNLDAALRPYANIQQGLVVVGLLGLLVAIIGSMVVARGVTGPLQRIARAAHGLMQGDWSQRAPVSSPDEVGLLAGSFNQMAERLESWDSDLRTAVAERTRELDSALLQLDGAFQQMRRFNADASHELRTPLTVIRGEAEVALRAARSPDEYETVLRLIQDETERMSRIIEQLMMLARADAGELRLERRSLALDDIVREVMHRVEVLAQARRIHLAAEELEPVLLEGDEDRLHQLVLNLLDNAIKYTPEGGEVRVRLRVIPGTRPAHPAEARLEIEDTGIGIAQADLPHVFDRFYRVDKARSRAQGGSGLGLSICRWIVEAHGGYIDVRSRPGQGSTFTVCLPGATMPSLDGLQPDFAGV